MRMNYKQIKESKPVKPQNKRQWSKFKNKYEIMARKMAEKSMQSLKTKGNVKEIHVNKTKPPFFGESCDEKYENPVDLDNDYDQIYGEKGLRDFDEMMEHEKPAPNPPRSDDDEKEESENSEDYEIRDGIYDTH